MTPSIWDRLADPSASPGAYTPLRMAEAVRRDLEELLNTRRTTLDIPAVFEATAASVVGYGMPDLAWVEAATPEDRAAVAPIVRAVVERFEPRLRDPFVELCEDNDRFSLRFRIAGYLAVDGSPAVTFESVLELTSGRTTVRREGNG